MNAMPQQTDLEEFTGTAVDLFSYAALSREDEASAREDAVLIRSHVEDIAKKGIEIGQALNRQKERMDHGLFIGWVRDECHLSDRVAQRLMRVAREVGSKAPSMAALGTTALDLLISDTTPQEVRDHVEALLVDGKKVTVADIRKMKADVKAADELAEARAKLEALQKESEDKDFENAGEIHKLQIQIESLEKGRDLARKDANTAESKASAVEKEMDERISIAVSEAAQKIEAGFKDEIRRLQLENAELRKPKPVAIVEGHTAEIVPFARDLTDEEKAEIDAEHDEYQDADFIETASDKDRAISVFGAIRNIATVKASPVAVYQHIASHSRATVDEYMSMVDYSLALLTTIKDYHHD